MHRLVAKMLGDLQERHPAKYLSLTKKTLMDVCDAAKAVISNCPALYPDYELDCEDDDICSSLIDLHRLMLMKVGEGCFILLPASFWHNLLAKGHLLEPCEIQALYPIDFKFTLE